MRLSASVSLVALAVGMATSGCSAGVEPSAHVGAGGESRTATGTTAPMSMLPPGVAAPGAAGAPRKLTPELITRGTHWVAFFNTYASYNNGSEWSQPYPFYSFPSPTAWIVPFSSGATNVVADLPDWVYERGELLPIVGSNNLPASEPFQFLVAEFADGNCTLPPAGPTSVGTPVPCAGTWLSGAYFMVPFTDMSATQALIQAENSSWGQSPGVQAFAVYHPIIHEAVVDSNGYRFVLGSDGQMHLMLTPPVAAYPLADVHDPKTPPH